MTRRLILALAVLAMSGMGAHAQLLGRGGLGGIGPGGIGPGVGGLPNVPVTTVPSTIAPPSLPPPPTALSSPPASAVLSNPVGVATAPVANLTQTVQGAAGAVARDVVGRPLGPSILGRDDRGFPIVADQVLALSPTPESLAIARQLNFAIVRQDRLGALGLSSTVLRAPAGMSAVDALAALRRADPAGTYDYANIYNPTGGRIGLGAAAQTLAVPAGMAALKIGMIDGGVDARHSAFATAHIVSRNFAGVANAPASEHGTAIASLLAGVDKDFTGYLPGATVYAADVFGGELTGGSAAEIALALNWLAENDIAVANISLAGPPNALLGAAVKAFVASGHMLVAAAGNDGPAAPPNYPAAYDGVIGVTATDAGHHLALDANRKARFAALGVDIRAAQLAGGYLPVSGTSYASPLVAARFALLVTQPGKEICAGALAQLTREAQPLAESGIAYLAPPPGRLAAR